MNQSHKQVDLAIFTPTMEGGVGRILFNLTKGLVSRGYTVEIVTLQETQHAFKGSDLRFVYLGKSRTFMCLPELKNYLRERQPKVFMSAIYHANLIAMLARFLVGSKTRMIICEHIALKQALVNEPFVLRVALKTLIGLFYRTAHAVVTVSNDAAKELRSAFVPGKKIHVIYNPVVTTDMQQTAAVQIDHPWFKVKTNPLILGVGRLTDQKDFGTLLTAFSMLSDTAARLVILGDGPDKETLESQIRSLNISGKVVLLGHVDNPYPYFKSSDLFVLSSKWEGLPTVLIEALALGVPVVSTDCPSGPREILKNGELGDLVPVGDAQSLSDAMRRALQKQSNPPSTDSLKEFSVEYAMSEYEKVIFS